MTAYLCRTPIGCFTSTIAAIQRCSGHHSLRKHTSKFEAAMTSLAVVHAATCLQ